MRLAARTESIEAALAPIEIVLYLLPHHITMPSIAGSRLTLSLLLLLMLSTVAFALANESAPTPRLIPTQEPTATPAPPKGAEDASGGFGGIGAVLVALVLMGTLGKLGAKWRSQKGIFPTPYEGLTAGEMAQEPTLFELYKRNFEGRRKITEEYEDEFLKEEVFEKETGGKGTILEAQADIWDNTERKLLTDYSTDNKFDDFFDRRGSQLFGVFTHRLEMECLILPEDLKKRILLMDTVSPEALEAAFPAIWEKVTARRRDILKAKEKESGIDAALRRLHMESWVDTMAAETCRHRLEPLSEDLLKQAKQVYRMKDAIGKELRTDAYHGTLSEEVSAPEKERLAASERILHSLFVEAWLKRLATHQLFLALMLALVRQAPEKSQAPEGEHAPKK